MRKKQPHPEARPTLTIVTHQQWRAEDFSEVADTRVDFGMDLTATDRPGSIWAPGAWAAAAAAHDPDLHLTSAGPRWLDSLPLSLTGRPVMTVPSAVASHLEDGAPRQFIKLPETKHDKFPAAVRDVEHLDHDLALLPADEPIQLQGTVSFTYEVRCWVVDRAVVASASYFPDIAREDWQHFQDRRRDADGAFWLQRALDAHPEVTVPDSVVIDVGWCTTPYVGDPGWRVIEANAAWSSDWYEPSDIASVLEAISRSQRRVSAWEWVPSPVLVRQSRRLLSRAG